MDNTVIFEAQEDFTVPSAVVDKHLNAPATELRLLLFLLRNKNRSFLTEDITSALKVTEEELGTAFEYWEKAGLLFNYSGRYSIVRPRIETSDIIKYSADVITSRMNSDSSVTFLCRQVEQALAKPLSQDDISAILSMIDWIGLPSEVVALLISYTTKYTKSLKKIVATAQKWAENGIDTYEKADEYVEKEEKKHSVEQRIVTILGISNRSLTENEKKLIQKWSVEYGFDDSMISAAYEATVKSTGKYSYPYLDAILTNWFKHGCKTVAEAAALRDSVKPEQPKKKTSSRGKKTDIDSAAAAAASWSVIDAVDETEE